MLHVMQKCYRFENLMIFTISILMYVLNTLIFSKITSFKLNYFFNCYFNDLLAPILLLSYINLLLSILKEKIYSLKYLILIILLCSIVWEYLIIYFKPNSVSDPLDVLFYLLGTLIYWFLAKTWIN
ncbi:MAG: hypothetical protein XD90_1759, partial [Methanobacterium sp. 42_16]